MTRTQRLLPSRHTTIDTRGRLWNVGPTRGKQWTALAGAPTSTDLKVGGSSPSERAQLRGPLPAPQGAFLVLVGATLGATRVSSH
jgi:hypothetical protein